MRARKQNRLPYIHDQQTRLPSRIAFAPVWSTYSIFEVKNASTSGARTAARGGVGCHTDELTVRNRSVLFPARIQALRPLLSCRLFGPLEFACAADKLLELAFNGSIADALILKNAI